MTRARMPRPHEVAAARRDPRLLRALSERHADTAWRTRGACRSVDPEAFFPAPSEPADAAVALCRTCEVQGPCLAWALDVGDCHGVWGATTPRERRAMLVAWRNQDGDAPPDATDTATAVREPVPTATAGRALVPAARAPESVAAESSAVGSALLSGPGDPGGSIPDRVSGSARLAERLPNPVRLPDPVLLSDPLALALFDSVPV